MQLPSATSSIPNIRSAPASPGSPWWAKSRTSAGSPVGDATATETSATWWPASRTTTGCPSSSATVSFGSRRPPSGSREEAEVAGASGGVSRGSVLRRGPGDQTGSAGGFADQVGEGEVGDEAGQSPAGRGSQHDDPDPGTTQLGEQRGELPGVR